MKSDATRTFLIHCPQKIREDLKETIQDLRCVGVINQRMEDTSEGFRLTVDAEEWRNSWLGTGGNESCLTAEAFQEELCGQLDDSSFEKELIVEEVRK